MSRHLSSPALKAFAVAAAVLLAALAAYVALARAPAPQVAFQTLDGEQLSTSDLRGRVVFVNFWATSCTTCIKEMPDVVRTYERFSARDFELLAVAMQYDPAHYVRNYVEQNQLPFKVVLDSQGTIAAGFDNVQLTPTAVLIDKNGKVVRRIVGEPDFASLNALIEEELRR